MGITMCSTRCTVAHLRMIEVTLIPGYLHVSVGNYQEAMTPNCHPLISVTGIVTDGDIEQGVVIIGALLMSWGFAIGISWNGNMGEPNEQ